MDKLTPDTTLAIMQTTQADASKAASKLKSVKGSIDIEKATEAAREFEAVFIAEMMKPMFEGISTDGSFGGGKGEEIFRGMMLEEYGKLLSQTGGIGIATDVKDTMIRMQQEADGVDPLSIQNQPQEIALTDGDSDATSN